MRRLAPLLLVSAALCACGSGVHTLQSLHGGVRTVRKSITVPQATGYRVIFYTTGRNRVNCDVTAGEGLGKYASCVQRLHTKPVTGVSMAPSGRLSICHGSACTPAGMAPELSVGEQVGWEHSPFDCKVVARGVRCNAAKTHSGFLIGHNGVQRVGHL
jgi:hypothetical protein